MGTPPNDQGGTLRALGHIGRMGCAHLGLGAPHPGSPVVLGPSSCPGPGGRRTPATAPGLSPDRVCLSVRPSAASWHCCQVLAPTHGGDCGTRLGDPWVTPQQGWAGRFWGVPGGGGSEPAPIAPAQPCPPRLTAAGEGPAGAQPEPPVFGEDGPTAGSCLSRHPGRGGSAPSGVSWGGWGAAPLRPAPLMGLPPAHLPPINGCFSSRAPDLPGICCNLAGSAPWPGRHSLPDAAPLSGGRKGCESGPPLWGWGCRGAGRVLFGEH